ncbi:MAG: adenosylcobinamide-GDP ribazoletransferase [Dehalococcoidales bacterium]|nr:adenosylcobinamide-GDP ribazoletransferase [Dehalococcoidales bacterium]
MGLLAALQFLTILPIKRSFTVAQIGQAAVFFPLVGIIIGAILVGLNYVLSLILPQSIVNVLLVAALAVVTGGLHLDGLADTLDGVGGQHTVQERLEIMKDSRIGGFGAVGIAVVLLVQFVTLNNIPSDMKMYVLLLTPTLSRWAMVNAIYVYPYARPSGMGRVLKKGLMGLHYALDAVFALMVSVALFRLGGLVIMAVAWLSADLTALFLKSKLKGLTGDAYGAINEMVTLAVLIVINILAFKHWLIA